MLFTFRYISVVIKLSFKYFFIFLKFPIFDSILLCASNLYFDSVLFSPRNNINMSYNTIFCSSAICRKNSIRCHLSLRASYFNILLFACLIFGAIFIFVFVAVLFSFRFWAGTTAGKLCSIIFSKNNAQRFLFPRIIFIIVPVYNFCKGLETLFCTCYFRSH